MLDSRCYSGTDATKACAKASPHKQNAIRDMQKETRIKKSRHLASQQPYKPFTQTNNPCDRRRQSSTQEPRAKKQLTITHLDNTLRVFGS
eukprot:4960887-Pleurochrysis_carterae.AAC.1